MQVNKCERCGCFFVSDSSICPTCTQKDAHDIAHLKNFLEEGNSFTNIEEIACLTGITPKNLHRLFQSDNLFQDNNSIL